jgi:hypothetical protein
LLWELKRFRQTWLAPIDRYRTWLAPIANWPNFVLKVVPQIRALAQELGLNEKGESMKDSPLAEFMDK